MTDELIRGAYLKHKIDEMKAELYLINRNLAKENPPENGSKTSRIYSKGIEAIIQLRENVKWDQSGLEKARALYPVWFNSCFKAEYKPIAKELGNIPAFADFVEQFKTVSEGQPSVNYEHLGGE